MHNMQTRLKASLSASPDSQHEPPALDIAPKPTMVPENKIPDDFDSPSYRPIVISGPSGVRKSTLIRKLLEAHPYVFKTTVSFTTRKPRPGEESSRAYDFISRDYFENLIRLGAFLEYTEYNGNFYGTAWNEIRFMTLGSAVPLLDIEMEGVKQLKMIPELDVRFVFIRPPSLEVLEKQLRGWGTEAEESIRRRLARAKEEMDFADTGVYDMVIVNDDLEVALEQLEEFCLSEVQVEDIRLLALETELNE